MCSLFQSSQLRHSVVLPVQSIKGNVGKQEISHLKVIDFGGLLRAMTGCDVVELCNHLDSFAGVT